MLDGLYENSPWIVQAALAQRPFVSLAQFKHCMTRVVDAAGHEAQLALIRAHPELAGKAMVRNTLTAESTHEQMSAGLSDCSPQEFARLQQLNIDYNTRFGWPFVLAVRGARGEGLSRQEIIASFERRLTAHPDSELGECMRNIHRIAEIRLNDKFGLEPTLGNAVWDWQEELSVHSDPGFAEKNQLTVTYLRQAHRACSAQIAQWMRDCGFDEVTIDAVGNVVGRYHASQPGAKNLLTGSHFDTVRNGGKYDGRLGIFVPMAAVRELHRAGRRLPYGIELIAFAEEEGQRFPATFLASSALIGAFQSEWLDQKDADGVTLREAMQHAGLRIDDIPKLRRDAASYLGFVEVHIEQGPVLNELNLPLGIVSSINGSVRYLGEITGMASHAGTTPMALRHDAALVAAKVAVHARELAQRMGGRQLATVGALQLSPNLVNVIAQKAVFTVDLRNTDAAALAQAEAELLAFAERAAQAEGVQLRTRSLARFEPVVFDAQLVDLVESQASALACTHLRMPSGAGHDAQMLARVCPSAMIFVPSVGGLSHNVREYTAPDDLLRGAQILLQVALLLANRTS